MNVSALVPGWVRDLRRRNDDTHEVEKALSEHSATLRGLTVQLEREIRALREGEVR